MKFTDVFHSFWDKAFVNALLLLLRYEYTFTFPSHVVVVGLNSFEQCKEMFSKSKAF